MTVLEDSTLAAREETEAVPEAKPAPQGERAGIYLSAIIALAVPSIIVLAFFLPNRAATPSTTAPVVDAAVAGLDHTDVTSEVSTDVEGSVETNTDNSQDSTAAPVVDDPIDLSTVGPEAIDVFVYDETPTDNGEYTFALRLKSVSTNDAIRADLFRVALEDSDGSSLAETTVRFVHESLPVGSSALATVRTGEITVDPTFIVISLGDREIDRVLLDVE